MNPINIHDELQAINCHSLNSKSEKRRNRVHDEFIRSIRLSYDGNILCQLTSNNKLIQCSITEPYKSLQRYRYYQQKEEYTKSDDHSPLKWGNMKEYQFAAEVHDYQFYPYSQINSESDDIYSSSFLLVAQRDHPIQLMRLSDAESGGNSKVIQSYVALNHVQEIDNNIQALSFNQIGNKFYAGGDSRILVFDLEHGVTDPTVLSTTGSSDNNEYGFGFDSYFNKKMHKYLGQRGVISCLAFNPDYQNYNCYATGTFNNTIAIHSENTGAMNLININFNTINKDSKNTLTGISCLRWSTCGKYLWISTRGRGNGDRNDLAITSDDITCWDIRFTKKQVGKVQKCNAYDGAQGQFNSQQRTAFDLDPWSNYLATGNNHGQILIYNTQTFQLENFRNVYSLGDQQQQQQPQTVNQCLFHPYSALLLTSVGSRVFDYDENDSDDDTNNNHSNGIANEDDDLDALLAAKKRKLDSSSESCHLPTDGSYTITWSIPFHPLEYPDINETEAIEQTEATQIE